MATNNPTHPNQAIFRGFDRSVENLLGADMRLIYGMLVPILMVCGLIVLLALSPATWVVAFIMAVEFILLGVVVVAFNEMIRDDDADDWTTLADVPGIDAATEEPPSTSR